ncbi:aldehyde dehydrogenase [Limibaculum sp. M0105]|uniref:Aldehyde dehydrogenase n=1 Tax=Thermohalobaculum xanthum TaxID=2753746 RepID=A0A8J7SEL4_9RHOB|nr:aldehyde dehydrogenase [Thermohalobaculum xanthum]MBK0399586.1 aldehyde dehydrogenase [Thermohalobaculum xanthum]
MKRETRWVAAALSAVALGLFSGTSAATEEGEFGVLVAGEGAELTYAYCAACHSERLVAQQGLTRDRWDALLQWMIDEQGMGELDPPDRELILNYLAENYGPDRPNYPVE